MDNPLHRITVWTGSYFRSAQLWEAGVYLLVPHCEGETHCSSLRFHKDNLERFQEANDDAENAVLTHGHPIAFETATPGLAERHMEVEDLADGPNGPTLESETLDDAELEHRLDILYQGQVEAMEGNSGNGGKSEDLQDLDDEHESELDDDDDGLSLPHHYMPSVSELHSAERPGLN
jgi:hypothetical protein